MSVVGCESGARMRESSSSCTGVSRCTGDDRGLDRVHRVLLIEEGEHERPSSLVTIVRIDRNVDRASGDRRRGDLFARRRGIGRWRVVGSSRVYEIIGIAVFAVVVDDGERLRFVKARST